MMRRTRINPSDFPPFKGESWWIVHPNTSGAEFRIPIGAMTVCKEDFMGVFKQNTAYNILGTDNHNGWVSVESLGDIYDMPQYLFSRYFDAEVFVVGKVDPVEIEKAKVFDYLPTVPRKADIKEFIDGQKSTI